MVEVVGHSVEKIDGGRRWCVLSLMVGIRVQNVVRLSRGRSRRALEFLYFRLHYYSRRITNPTALLMIFIGSALKLI